MPQQGASQSSSSGKAVGFKEKPKEKKKDDWASFLVLAPRYTDLKKIGSGAYGVVCSAMDSTTGGKVAIKRVHPWADDEWDARHTLRELRLMRLLSAHPNIITLKDVAVYPSNDLFIVMELMESDLHRIITSKQVLTCAHVSCLTAQLLLGVQAMHGLGVLHRDLKPGNLLVSRGCQLRITDFGLSRYIEPDDMIYPRRGHGGQQRESPRTPKSKDDEDEEEHVSDDEKSDDDDATRKAKRQRKRKKQKKKSPLTEYVVTRWYRCPEVLLAPHLPYSTSVDCWSAGCIFAELIRRKPLFQGKNFVHQVQVILERLGTPDPENFGFEPRPDAARFLAKQPYHNDPGLTTLLPTATASQITFAKRLLTFNPQLRASVDEALADDYFIDMPELPGRSQSFFPRARRRADSKDDDSSRGHPETKGPQQDDDEKSERDKYFWRHSRDDNGQSKAALAFREAVLADDGFEFGFEHPDTALDDLRHFIHEDIHKIEATRKHRLARRKSPEHYPTAPRQQQRQLPAPPEPIPQSKNQDEKRDDDEHLTTSPGSSKDDASVVQRRKAAPKRSNTLPSSRRSLDDNASDNSDEPTQTDSRRRLFGLPLPLTRSSRTKKSTRIRPTIAVSPVSPNSSKKPLSKEASSSSSSRSNFLSRFRSSSSTSVR